MTDHNDNNDSNDTKKERVIHTRVSETLERELKDRASHLGVSVSKLVRNVLQNTFGLVDGIIADSVHVARAASRLRNPHEPPMSYDVSQDVSRSTPSPASSPTAPPPSPPPTPKIIGYQELILNLNALCAKCNAILPRGARAAVAVLDPPAASPRAILCTTCIQETPAHDTEHRDA
jgi:hypothetical protein